VPSTTSRTSRTRPSSGDPDRTLAARSASGGGWECLLIECASTADPGSRRLLDRRSCRSDEELASWVEESRAGRCLMMLPSAATICRVFRFPGMPGDQIDQALRLQAESHLLGGIASHRTTIVRVPQPESGEAVGLLLAWPEQATTRMPSGRARQWEMVPEIAALLEAWRTASVKTPLVWADPADGSIGVVAGDAGTPMLRATCEAAEGDEPWDQVVRRVVGETVLAAGGSADVAKSTVERADAGMIEQDAVRASRPALFSDLDGLDGRDSVGALLDAAIRTARGPLAAAATLTAEPPSIRRTGVSATFERVAIALTTPRTAIRVAIVAVIVALAMPLAGAGLRTAILRAKLPDPDAFEAAMKASEQQLAVYRELEAQAWPMMKILGDLSNCMPEAIEVESLTMGHGEPVVVRGFAKPDGDVTGADAVLEMERRLRATRVFDKITKSWDPPDARGIYEFSMSAEVARPTTRARVDENDDFAVNTLAIRRYGPLVAGGVTSAGDASEASPSIPDSTGDEASTASSDNTARGRTDTEAATSPPDSADSATASSSGGSTPSRGIGRRGSSASGDAPPGGRGVDIPSSSTPSETVDYSDAEVAAMSKAEAQSALGRVARARQSASLDDAAKERLRALFDKLLQRVREAE
jgi:Tfp pilus assembly protein PilN